MACSRNEDRSPKLNLLVTYSSSDEDENSSDVSSLIRGRRPIRRGLSPDSSVQSSSPLKEGQDSDTFSPAQDDNGGGSARSRESDPESHSSQQSRSTERSRSQRCKIEAASAQSSQYRFSWLKKKEVRSQEDHQIVPPKFNFSPVIKPGSLSHQNKSTPLSSHSDSSSDNGPRRYARSNNDEEIDVLLSEGSPGLQHSELKLSCARSRVTSPHHFNKEERKEKHSLVRKFADNDGKSRSSSSSPTCTRSSQRGRRPYESPRVKEPSTNFAAGRDREANSKMDCSMERDSVLSNVTREEGFDPKEKRSGRCSSSSTRSKSVPERNKTPGAQFHPSAIQPTSQTNSRTSNEIHGAEEMNRHEKRSERSSSSQKTSSSCFAKSLPHSHKSRKMSEDCSSEIPISSPTSSSAKSPPFSQEFGSSGRRSGPQSHSKTPVSPSRRHDREDKSKKNQREGSCSDGVNPDGKKGDSKGGRQKSGQRQTQHSSQSTSRDRDEDSPPPSNEKSMEIDKFKPDLPKFDISAILKDKFDNDEKGQKICALLEGDKNVETSAQRKHLVRTLTRWLFFSHVSDPKTVTTEMKEGLAKSIVSTYPVLALEHHSLDEGSPPWVQFYNCKVNTGWIANSARSIQKRHRKRRTLPKQSADETRDSEYGSDEIESLSLLMANRKTREEISRGMEACFKTRKVERKRGETVDYFLKKYPHFRHFGGEIMLEEFSMMFPEAADLSRPFLDKLPKILSLPLKRPLDLKLNDDVLKALFCLSNHLPHDIPKGKDKDCNYSWAQEEDLFVVLDSSDSIPDYVFEKVNNSTKPVQPYFILVKSVVDKKIVKGFLVLDGKEMEVTLSRSHPTLQALNILLKSYCVFNVLHPFGWRNTLHFVQHYFLNIREKQYHRSSRGGEYTSPSEIELWEKLQ